MAAVITTKKEKLIKHQKPLGKLTGWYTSYVFRKKRRHLVVGAIILVVAAIIGQLFYPTDKALPWASIRDVNVGMATHDEMAKLITDSFNASKIRLIVGNDKKVEYSLKNTGAEPNTEGMIKQLSDYPLWQRLLPGSIVWLRPQLTTADIYYTTIPLEKFVDEQSKQLSFPPQNARLVIKNGQLEADESIAGSQVKASDLFETINQTEMVLGETTVISVPSIRTKAARSASDLAKVRQQAEATLAHTVEITAADQRFSPDKMELASWVLLTTDQKGDVTLSIDSEKIKAYLAKVNQEVGKPAGQTNISIVNGREVGRTIGASGRAIAIDAIAQQLTNALLVSPSSITIIAPFVDVQPSIIFNSKYTTTQEGLQAYVSDVANTRNMRISVQQLDGGKWSAGARQHESIPSGSTYKLFVAFVLFDRINKGEIHWGDPMLDTTVAGCFERMTVASTNPCAESWIAQFGRQYINDFIHARGFSSGTSFTTGYANQTTAADLTKYMMGLNDGTLVAGSNRDRLLSSLGRHPYRYGIPTGSQGRVNDKVGFLWDYVHDTAIVHHPRGTYILTIMTKGQSYGAIANVTREIERIMYP